MHKHHDHSSLLITSLDVLTGSAGAVVHVVPHSDTIDDLIPRTLVTAEPDQLDRTLAGYEPGRHTTPLRSFVFDPLVGMSGNLFHAGSDYQLAIKGAPEHVLRYCDLTDTEREHVTLEYQKLSGSGGRVIAIASLDLDQPLHSLSQLADQSQLKLAGFVVVVPAISPRARRLILDQQKSGTTIYLMTGEHAAATAAIARETQLIDRDDHVVDMYHQALRQTELPPEARVFCRATPEQKDEITRVLQARHPGLRIVTTLGDLHR